MVFNYAFDEQHAVFQKARIDIVSSLAAGALLDNHWYDGLIWAVDHWELLISLHFDLLSFSFFGLTSVIFALFNRNSRSFSRTSMFATRVRLPRSSTIFCRSRSETSESSRYLVNSRSISSPVAVIFSALATSRRTSRALTLEVA